MSKRNKKSKRAHALVEGSSSASMSASLSCSESAPIEHLVESHVVPFPHYPRRPFSISLKKEELFQNIFIIEQFLLKEECQLWIEHAEQRGFEEVFQAATSEYAHRDNGRLQFDDSAVAERIFHRLESLLPAQIDGLSPCGCSSNIRLYRYSEGQRFGRHIDESHSSSEGVSKYTLLIYLNGSSTSYIENSGLQADQANTKGQLKPNSSSTKELFIESDKEIQVDLRGGETQFYTSLYGKVPKVSVSPVMGRLLLHGHGHRCLTHEGAEVTSGVKYLLRTDVLYS